MATEQSVPYSFSKSQRAVLAARELHRFQVATRRRQHLPTRDLTQLPRWRRTADALAGAEFGVSPELVRRATKLEQGRSDLADQVVAGNLTLSEALKRATVERSACVFRAHCEYQLPSVQLRKRGGATVGKRGQPFRRESIWVHRSFEVDLGPQALDYSTEQLGRFAGRFVFFAMKIEGFPVKTRTWTPTAKDLELLRGSKHLVLGFDGAIRERRSA